MSKKLRFAALIRVSTEKQATRGESLLTQRKQITDAVAAMGGKVVATYAGQEHATAGWERTQLNKLLADARRSSKPFDAVIVTDPSRWSRDNVANETGLDTLRDNGIRFFVLGMEFDLFDPMHRHILASQAGINKLHASLQKQKSLLNRIERAKRGIPTGGKMPFGRTFNRTTNKWEIDPKKKKMVEDCAKRYLAGEPMGNLAKQYGVNHTSLHKTLTKRCGTEWEIRFDADDLNIHEVVQMRIPALLPASTIKAILERVDANKTYRHGRPKHPYILSGMVFCGHCGYRMSSQPNRGASYYRHAGRERLKKCSCAPPQPYVRCDVLEEAVLRHILDCFGNPTAIEKAIRDATPNKDRIEELQAQQKQAEGEVAKLKTSRAKLLRALEYDLAPESEVHAKLAELKKREATLQAEVERLAEATAHVPTPETVKEVAIRVASKIKYSNARLAIKRLELLDPDKLTLKQKRELVLEVFDGRRTDGTPMGVYIEQIPGQQKHRQKKWKFTLYGRVVDGDQLVLHCASHSPSTALPGRRCARRPLRPAG